MDGSEIDFILERMTIHLVCTFLSLTIKFKKSINTFNRTDGRGRESGEREIVLNRSRIGGGVIVVIVNDNDSLLLVVIMTTAAAMTTTIPQV